MGGGCRITLECEGCLSTAAGWRWEREKRRKSAALEGPENLRSSDKPEMFLDPAGRSRISRGTPDQNNKSVEPLRSFARFGPRRCRRCRIKSYLKTRDLVHISQRRRFWWRGFFFSFCTKKNRRSYFLTGQVATQRRTT